VSFDILPAVPIRAKFLSLRMTQYHFSRFTPLPRLHWMNRCLLNNFDGFGWVKSGDVTSRVCSAHFSQENSLTRFFSLS